ncbi:MAG: macro domain-containing protein [Acidimicrobiales bacterium]
MSGPVAEPGISVVDGDLLDVLDVEAIVNAWNRNVVPWWLLYPSGVSKAIRRRAGVGPFRELARLGRIPLGGAVTTGAGRLPYRGIIHVAGIDLRWRASPGSVASCTRSALAEARAHGFGSLAFPIIGSGSGGLDSPVALDAMLATANDDGGDLRIVVVRHRTERRN